MPASSEQPLSDPRDIRFQVSMTHRVRFTREVADQDFDELHAVLHSQPGTKTRVLLWADIEVANSSERVAHIERRLFRCADLDLEAPVTLFPGGESIKNEPAIVDTMLDQIHHHQLDRRSYIIVIGGGALLDVAGYAAAIAHRGIRLVRLPTTTLAQGDSGVGVKNAVNRYGKKNWVGTFVTPWAVINDAGFLQTLPAREFRCGFSEAVKVSLLKSPDLFRRLCQQASAIRDQDLTSTVPLIEESCRWHLRHITEGGDPFEMDESRPLDFGHWSAHRLEPLTDFRIRHGEAVGIGVALDALYSSLKHGLPEADALRVCQCLSDMGLPLWDTELEPFDRMLQGLEEFRQHLGGRLTVTMLQGIGKPIDVHQIDPVAMRDAATRLQEFAAQVTAR